jgi:type I restriction enzyme S subunit
VTVMTLDEAFVLNPTVSLSKGTVAPFVDMAALQPFRRDVYAVSRKPYAGGMKFLDGDVLMARITPSLENGKTSIYRAALGETGAAFGSTEFIVIRGREGVSDSRFAYYLFTSNELREHAIASMNGSSGRQRVQHDSLASYEIDLPPIDEQRGIAAALGALDDKIESNRRLRQIMWDFLAAEYDQLSAGSEPVEIRQLLNLYYGKSLPAVKRVPGSVPVYGSNGITGNHDRELIAGPGVIVGRKGSIGEVHWTHVASFPIDTTFYVSPISGFPLLACYFALRNAQLRGKNSDSAIPGLNREAALGTQVLAPPMTVVQNWSASRQPILGHVYHLDRENDELTALRDALLPELLSGRIRVPEVREAVQEVVA